VGRSHLTEAMNLSPSDGLRHFDPSLTHHEDCGDAQRKREKGVENCLKSDLEILESVKSIVAVTTRIKSNAAFSGNFAS